MSLILSGTDGLSDVDGSAATPAIRGTDANTGIFFPAADTIGVSTGGSERMRIDSLGNVGIGVSTVATNFRTQFLGTAGSNTSAASSGTTQAASAVLRLQSGGGFTGTLDIGQGGATGSWLQSCDTTNLATTYPLFLNPVGGNVLVGTTSGTEKFCVTTSANASTAFFLNNNGTATNQYGIVVKLNGDPNNVNHMLQCLGGANLRAEIRSNGGLANYSANNVNLSDERTKTDITTAGNYLAKICAIPVRTFKYKDQSDDLLSLGVIAQEVELIAPELVNVDGFGETPDDGIPLKAIYQTDLQYALMKCIQEQQALITQLTNRISALENK